MPFLTVMSDVSFSLLTSKRCQWVVSSNCTQTDCTGVPKYAPTSSLNMLSEVPFNLNYLMGSVSGSVGTETVALGPFEISSQVLGELDFAVGLSKEQRLIRSIAGLANGTAGLGLSGTGNSGILGLSFPMEAAIPDTAGRTLVENLLASFDESHRYFAFKLGEDQAGTSFTIGQIDPAFANDTSQFAFTAVYPSTPGTHGYDYWKIPIHSLTINGTTFQLPPSIVAGADSPIAVMDTGTTLILGPTADVDRLYNSIGGARKDDAQNQWQIRCDRAISVGFILGDGDSKREYIMNPADLSWQVGGRDGDWCLGGIQPNDGVRTAIVTSTCSGN